MELNDVPLWELSMEGSVAMMAEPNPVIIPQNKRKRYSLVINFLILDLSYPMAFNSAIS